MKVGAVLCATLVFCAGTAYANNPVLHEFDYSDYDYPDDSEQYIELRSEIETEFEDRLRIASVTVLMDAAKYGTSSDIRKLLKDGEYIHKKDYDGCTALDYAVEYNMPEVVQTLIEAGAYVSKLFLLQCVQNGMKHPEVVGILVKSGVNVNAADNEGNTVLIRAVDNHSYASVGVVNALLEAGAEVNAKNNYGKTALMFAAATKGRTDSINALIRAGALINAKDKAGKTPLIHAAEIGNASALNVLINARANIHIKDNNGMTALDYAQSCKTLPNDILKRLGASWYQLHWF